jgi:nitrogenase molybdenum-iron protein alpha/beta subunit
MKIGVVGYSSAKFNEDVAKALIAISFDTVEVEHGDDHIIVSGLTDLGIPALAYREAKKRGWKTKGIACKKAEEYDLYPVEETEIVGDDWGDESETFLNDIEVLIRIGGGEQSMDETQKAKDKKIPVFEYDLPEKKD